MKLQKNALAAVLAGMLALGATACAEDGDATDPVDDTTDALEEVTPTE